MTTRKTPPRNGATSAAFMPVDREMGEMVTSFDWATTPLGPARSWPASLRAHVGLVMTSRFPMLLWWGPELIQIYNTAYRPILGDKHPASLGARGPEVWREVWHILGPQAEQVLAGGEATWNEHLLLPMERRGYREETYFTFSYSPVPGDDGTVAGVLVTCQETTSEVFDGRQLRTLRSLAARGVEHETAEAACRAAAAILDENPGDLPFAACLLLEEDSDVARLVGGAGLTEGATEALQSIALGDEPGSLGRICEEALRSGSIVEISVDALPFSVQPRNESPVPIAPTRAAVVPLARPGQGRCYGFLVAGVSAARPWDATYRGFYPLIAQQIAGAVANARARAEERRRIEALLEIDRAKTTFFSNISHEFRTPLTLILGHVEAAAAAERPLEDAELGAVERSAQRLLRLVNSLLDFAGAEAGRLDILFQPVDLAALTEDVVSQFRSLLENAGIRLEVDCAADELAWIDSDAWEKIVLNLLSNAYKHTFDGRVTCRLRTDGDAFVLEVSDTGVGIPAAQIDRVFDRLHRIDGQRSRTHEGSGIGLALAREFVLAHGGTIEVESEVDVGSTFIVRIPRGRDHLPADRVQDGPSIRGTNIARSFVDEAAEWDLSSCAGDAGRSDGDEKRPRILLVDDNADMRSYLSRLLSESWDVVATADGKSALQMALEELPDVVVSDVMMPGLDGSQLLTALRSHESTANIPVILVSARAGEEARIAALESGANDYIVKPFPPRELQARVATQLALVDARRKMAKLAADHEEASRAKEEFLAMLGHELRNPLAPIVTALQLLEGRGETAREHVIIERQVKHLVRLVDDLLDITRIVRGKIDLRRKRIDLATVLARSVEQVSPLLDRRRHQLEFDAGPARDVVVNADQGRLVQVFANLLTNAARYSDPRSRIEISVACEDGVAAVRVTDRGIGIDPTMKESIFEPFTQQRQTISRPGGGLGLGLAIVRNLVELHGGAVSVESDGLGEGATFVVTLPAETRPAPEESSDRLLLQATGRSRRVLLVDDNRDAADMLALALETMGHDVTVAHDGPSALALASKTPFEIALVDIGLPVMDGYELGPRLHEICPDLALIAVTGYGQSRDLERTAQLGFRDHLVKPVSLTRITESIDRVSVDASDAPIDRGTG